ncbi:unnamed protein product [Zymoseptoria tritici ST99CH_3D7]|uniref:Uncharacterized protein n=1 Tax=Zymoseptoria tritici (strain ST99CH_3D7) TaxID=1276538 RepID=A0A1X7RU43_ZYMT9|nr:unnamed protein product [Zymoseptoria tritici ST99CH_3D7]
MQQPQLQQHEPFPSLHASVKLATDSTAYDVKFYPFGAVDDDQIFAVVAERDAFVCRPKLGSDPPFEILRTFRDSEPDATSNSLAWAKDPETDKPLLCLAGGLPRHIKVLDVESGNPVRTLSGHGKAVNDLAISPLSTSLLASCAEDTTIRLWSLLPQHEDQPCVALFGGEGHKSPVLAIHFHPNGNWLLSGGIDTAVCLWAVPSLDELNANGSSSTTRKEPMIIYYPHFFSKELHFNYVDSLAFYGDLIISRASKDQEAKGNKSNNILIWKISGFDSDDPPPESPPIPVHGQQTRSSFPHDPTYRGFKRLLTLNMPDTDRFYHRFGLLHAEGRRPMLAMGNQSSVYSFWDLQKLHEGIDRTEKRGRKKGVATAASAAGKAKASASIRSESIAESTPDLETTSLPSNPSSDAPPIPSARDTSHLSDPFKPIDPHHRISIKTKLITKHFATSQIAWSPDGKWMVGVGDEGFMCLFHRELSGSGEKGK